MICLGKTDPEKQKIIGNYLKENNIKTIYLFYPEKYELNLDLGVDIEYIKYTDIIEYATFYHLLEVIDQNSLLIFNECMRTQNRNDLTYNCAHHYCNQTEHKIVFEYFPFVENKEDIMILLNFIDKNKYKGKPFNLEYLNDVILDISKIKIDFETIDIIPTDQDIKKYETKKNSLFDNIGMSDPDTIPRQLHVYAGNNKKQKINKTNKYIGRNQRFKKENITTYKQNPKEEHIIIDFPQRQIEFNDYLKTTKTKKVIFINSGLKVDIYYMNEFKNWLNKLEVFYAETSVYKNNS